jgi:hypothetical protein
MSGAINPHPQSAFMARCLVKAQVKNGNCEALCCVVFSMLLLDLFLRSKLFINITKFKSSLTFRIYNYTSSYFIKASRRVEQRSLWWAQAGTAMDNCASSSMINSFN